MSGSSFGVCFLAKCLEMQPWIVEDEKQLRNATEAQKAQQQRCLFRQIPGSVKKKTNLLNWVVVVLQIPKTTTSNDLSSF